MEGLAGMNVASTSSRKAPSKLDHIRVKSAKNGGFTVEHHYQNDGGSATYKQPDIYAFGDGPETAAHLNDHLGVKENKKISNKQRLTVKQGSEPGGEPDNEVADNEPVVKQGNRRTRAEQRGHS